MGWKVSALVVNSINEETSFEEILRAVGFDDLEKIQDKSFDAAMYPASNEIYVGIYKGNLIITCKDLPLCFMNTEQDGIQRLFIQQFREAEIGAISLNSTNNHWGFAIITNGEKIRVKTGDMDRGLVLDWGRPVAEEAKLLSRSRLNSKGEREYLLDNADEPYTEDQVGEDFIFEIWKRYTGERLDEDDDLFDTVFFGYRRLSSTESEMPDDTYSGQWLGHYTFGDGYSDIVKGRSSSFIIEMDVKNGSLKGLSQEERKEPAVISGFILDKFIGFIKQYPVRYSLNEKGESILDTAQGGTPILYSGLFDDRTNSFKGIWRIEGKNNWGVWSMKKK